MGREMKMVAQIALSMAQAWYIHCEDNSAIAGGLSPLQQFYRNGQVAVDVDLKPERATGGCGHGFKACAGDCTDNHQCTGLTGCTCCGQFAIRVGQAMNRGRCDHNGGLYGCSQYGSCCMAGAHIDQHPGTQAYALVDRAIGFKRYLIVAASLVIVPGSRIHVCFGKHFVVMNIELYHLVSVAPATGVVTEECPARFVLAEP